jgi:hypothetical protein
MERRQPEVACAHTAPTLRFQPVKEANDALLDDARHGDLLRRYPLAFLKILEQELESIPVGPYGVGAYILLPGQVIGQELRQVEGEISRLHLSRLPCSG